MTISFDKYKAEWVWKRVQETAGLWYQCVAHVKHFAKLVHWMTLGSFSWAAISCWRTGSGFVGKPYQRVIYDWNWTPPRGAIVFFNKTKKNKYWHVAIAWTSSKERLRVMEQNAGQGDGDGMNGDEITIRNYPYKGGKTGDVLWWYTLKNTTNKELYWA